MVRVSGEVHECQTEAHIKTSKDTYQRLSKGGLRISITMSMLQPLRYHQIRLARPKKHGGKDRRSPNNSGLKYSIRVLRNAKEATHLDQDNGNKLWTNKTLKELEALMSMKVFRKLPSSLRRARARGFQFVPLRMIFDIQVDLRRKDRLVIGGHVVDFYGHGVYASTMKSVSDRILMKIEAANNLYVMKGDIGNDYLNTNTQEILIPMQALSLRWWV